MVETPSPTEGGATPVSLADVVGGGKQPGGRCRVTDPCCCSRWGGRGSPTQICWAVLPFTSIPGTL